MKLLSKRECDEILKRISACHIIANEYISDIEAFKKITDNLAEITLSVVDVKEQIKFKILIENIVNQGDVNGADNMDKGGVE